MTTITINDPRIEKMFSKTELEALFMNFLQEKLEEDFNLYQISFDDLSLRSKERLENIDKLNFVQY